MWQYFDKFYYAERYFNQIQLDDQATQNPKYLDMKAFLNQKCLVYPIVLMTQHNLFNLHYVFWEQKIAIQYHVSDQCNAMTGEPNNLKKLTSKLMRYEDWEVLDLTEKQFKDWKTQEKIDEVKGWLKAAKGK